MKIAPAHSVSLPGKGVAPFASSPPNPIFAVLAQAPLQQIANFAVDCTWLQLIAVKRPKTENFLITATKCKPRSSLPEHPPSTRRRTKYHQIKVNIGFQQNRHRNDTALAPPLRLRPVALTGDPAHPNLNAPDVKTSHDSEGVHPSATPSRLVSVNRAYSRLFAANRAYGPPRGGVAFQTYSDLFCVSPSKKRKPISV